MRDQLRLFRSRACNNRVQFYSDSLLAGPRAVSGLAGSIMGKKLRVNVLHPLLDDHSEFHIKARQLETFEANVLVVPGFILLRLVGILRQSPPSSDRPKPH